MVSQRLFVTGMIRSGTTLAQTLLTNHPGACVAYQPFHQLYVDVKRMFLDESSIGRELPLDDGSPAAGAEREQFLSWLADRKFSVDEAEELAGRATTGKGGGIADLGRLEVAPGTFADVRESLHRAMALRIAGRLPYVIGSKEVLCEEYVPALAESGTRCVLIIRDPRGVIASANNGRYRDQVGDRYPLMMLIRLWRKTAAYWLKYRNHPLVKAIRYEDLATAPGRVLEELADWLGIERFPEDLARTPLKDHFGRPWSGNSSFGDRVAVDSSTNDSWRELLASQEQRFVSACAWRELNAIGYPVMQGVGPDDIRGFSEDTRGVRAAYLERHVIDDETRRDELERLAQAMDPFARDSAAFKRHFLFPEAHAPADGRGN